MGYSDLASAKAQLSLDDANPGDAADIALLVEIDAEVSRTLELKTGRKWGGTAAARAVVVDGPAAAPADVLLLPAPIRSVTSVAFVGSAPQTLPGTDYVLWNVTRSNDAHALLRIANGYWPARDGTNRIVVTGVWSEDAPGGDVPAEVVAAATFVTVETFRQRKTSPAGELGPEGFTIRPRNPWAFEVVKAVLAEHAARPVVSF